MTLGEPLYPELQDPDKLLPLLVVPVEGKEPFVTLGAVLFAQEVAAHEPLTDPNEPFVHVTLGLPLYPELQEPFSVPPEDVEPEDVKEPLVTLGAELFAQDDGEHDPLTEPKEPVVHVTLGLPLYPELQEPFNVPPEAVEPEDVKEPLATLGAELFAHEAALQEPLVPQLPKLQVAEIEPV